MGALSDSLEVSLSAAFELGTVDEEEHAGVIAGARAAASALDLMEGTERGYASVLSSYLNFCKALGIVPSARQQAATVVGDGRLARMRAKSRAGLRAV